MKNRKSLLFSTVIAALFTTTLAFAEAPVEDASSDYQPAATAAGGGEAVATPVQEDRHFVRSAESGTTAVSEVQEQPGSARYQDENGSSSAAAPQQWDNSNLPMGQRVKHLEQQVNNIANMNMPQQLNELQQQVAKLRGQLEVERHNAELLKKQLADFYKDLDTRIGQPNSNGNNAKSASVDSAATNAESPKGAPEVSLQDAKAYQAAFASLTNRKYGDAEQGFLSYIKTYPNGKYAADSHYWLGEIYLLNKDAAHAEAEFQTVMTQYAHSPKVSDAKLKTAIIHANAGKIQQAKLELLDIKKKNPNSTAAQLANIRLQQMEQTPQ